MTKEEEFSKIMTQYYEQCVKEANETFEHNKQILKEIKETTTKSFYNELIECIENCECEGKFRIVKNPKGNFQKEKYKIIKGYWVEQQNNDNPDSYSGTLTIKIDEERYLEMPFQL